MAQDPNSTFTKPVLNTPKTDTPIRVLVVDDHPSMRMGLIALVNAQKEMEVIAEASDGEEAIEVYEDVKPDVVLMDLRMPGMGGSGGNHWDSQEVPGCECDHSLHLRLG